MASDYEVGYGKPPKTNQFPKGQSGNPEGRPKHTRNLKTDLLEELNEEIPIRDGTRIKHVTKQRALVRTLMVKALKGDIRSATTLVNMTYRLVDLDDPASQAPQPLSAEEREVLVALEARLIQKATGPTPSTSPHTESHTEGGDS